MELFIFAVTAVIAVIGAIMMLLSKNAVHSALWLLLNFGSIAVLYLLLRAPFLFAIQLIVYAGAIIVLFLFVVMLLGAEQVEDDQDAVSRVQRPLALLLGAALLVEAGYVFYRSNTLGQVAATATETFAEPREIAAALFTTYLLPFEITGVILLAAVAGVVVLHQNARQQSEGA